MSCDADPSQPADGYSPPLATFAAFDKAPQQPQARRPLPPYMPRQAGLEAVQQHRKSAFAEPPAPDMPRSHAAAATAPTQQSVHMRAAATCDRKGSMQALGRQRSASSEPTDENLDQTPGSRQRSGSGSVTEAALGTPAGSGTVEQARELQQLRRQVAELRQRLDRQFDAEAKLRGELEGARRAAEAAQQDAEATRRQVRPSSAPDCHKRKQSARV